jgi:putative phage-type endonuclease
MLTKKQKEIRKNGIGGSDISAIAGISPFKTPLDIYLDKMTGIEDQPESNAIRFGNLFEDIIRKEYAKDHNVKVTKPNANHPKFHSEYKFAFANVDGIINNKDILEIKTTNQFNSGLFGEEGTDEIPNYYLCQVAWYRNIYSADFCDIAVLIGGQELKYFRYEKNEELENKLFNIAEHFWNNHILTQTPPEPQNYNDVLKLYPEQEQDALYLDSDLELLIADYQNLSKRKKTLENKLNELKKEISKKLGSAGSVLDDNNNKIVSFKKPKSSLKFDLDQFKEQHPDLYQRYLSEKENTRKLIITNKEF